MVKIPVGEEAEGLDDATDNVARCPYCRRVHHATHVQGCKVAWARIQQDEREILSSELEVRSQIAIGDGLFFASYPGRWVFTPVVGKVRMVIKAHKEACEGAPGFYIVSTEVEYRDGYFEEGRSIAVKTPSEALAG